MPEHQPAQVLELRHSIVCECRCLIAFPAHNSNTDMRFLDHVNVVCSVTDCQSLFALDKGFHEEDKLCLLKRGRSVQDDSIGFEEELLDLLLNLLVVDDLRHSCASNCQLESGGLLSDFLGAIDLFHDCFSINGVLEFDELRRHLLYTHMIRGDQTFELSVNCGLLSSEAALRDDATLQADDLGREPLVSRQHPHFHVCVLVVLNALRNAILQEVLNSRGTDHGQITLDILHFQIVPLPLSAFLCAFKISFVSFRVREYFRVSFVLFIIFLNISRSGD
jgi:hypothetical protein